jgi:deferrochelatase/peroxidase EfeB
MESSSLDKPVVLTRQRFLRSAAVLGLSAAGLYELVDQLAAAPRRNLTTAKPRGEQHLLAGQQVVTDEGIEVIVPPLHHQVVTAKLQVEGGRKSLLAAKVELEEAIRRLEREYEPTPSGLGITVAWGLPYFREYVPGPARAHMPIDERASKAKGRQVMALFDAIRYPSDPPDTILEANDLAVLLRSDSRDHVSAGAHAIFRDLSDVFAVTSIRRGFVGGGFTGERGLPKQMAIAAGVPGAERIPDGAELFLGFTSTQRAAMGPSSVSNLETLGYTSRNKYFVGGTVMHLSHMYEDLEAWYHRYAFDERVATAFRPGLDVPEGTLTVSEYRTRAYASDLVASQYHHTGVIGHSAAIQTASRLSHDIRGADGTLFRRGTAVPQRADFNTLDHPFAWSSQPQHDGMRDGPAAGVHFISFQPTSDDFDRVRLAMDGVLPDGTELYFEPHDRGQGFNSILTTTHRQNFLVPPRKHRSFPLSELMS